jgi:2-polyprenyl-3-methyl-5-hydroxy-6-metoxy-1,4-benzoquinol methylase
MMNKDFGHWAKVGELTIDQLEERILTNSKEKQFSAECWMFPLIGDKTKPLAVLDFGCGLGRNTWPMAKHSDRWMITGYDNPVMLARIPEYKEISNLEMLRNIRFSSDWDSLKHEWFDCIVCTLVLQHVKEEVIAEYVKDFKGMTNRVVILSRRFNDHGKKNTWEILEEQGLVPSAYFSHDLLTLYTSQGNRNDHNTAVYSL